MIPAVLAMGLLALYFPSALLRDIPDSTCPDLEAQQYFNKHRFQGQWLAQGSWRGIRDYSEFACSIYDFKLKDINRMSVKKWGYDPESEETYNKFAYVRNVDSTNPACWEVITNIGDEAKGVFRILDTDYSDYALVYGCLFEPYDRLPYVLVMSKIPFPEYSRIVKAVESASRFGYSETDFVWMDRYAANCSEKLNRRG